MSKHPSFPITPALNACGTLHFTFKTPRAWLNGNQDEGDMRELFAIPALGEFEIGLCEDLVSTMLHWNWDREKATPGTPNVWSVLPEIPGPEVYHLCMSWNQPEKVFNLYLNGIAMRHPDLPDFKFDVPDIQAMHFNSADFGETEIHALANFTPDSEIKSLVPSELYRKHERLFGVYSQEPQAIDVESRRGELLYENPLDKEGCIDDWVIDAGRYSFVDGALQIETDDLHAKKPALGQMTIWCPQTFPDSFLAEWNVRVSRDNLAIVFFAAHGTEGRDIFDPSMPKRIGDFTEYIKGEIKSYHISYYAHARGISNLRKNNKFYLMTTGPEGIPTRSRDEHTVRLVKDGNHIQAFVDGRNIIDYVDQDEKRYDAPYKEGKIGFRQMRTMIGHYRNLKVWDLGEA